MAIQNETPEQRAARWAREEEEARVETKNKMAEFIREMRAKGVHRVEVQYDGYGDSGDVESMEFFDENNRQLVMDADPDLFWGFAYSLYPGFEINDGASGVITIDVPSGRISVDHSQRYTATTDYHQDINL